MIRVELAGPAQGKGRGRAVSIAGHARVYSDPKTVRYESQIRYVATQVMGDRPPLDGPVAVTMWVMFAVPDSWSNKKRLAALSGRLLPTVKPDADNTLKLCDALNGICFLDDKQVVDARVIKRYAQRPSLVIDIRDVVVATRGFDEATEPAPLLDLLAIA